jgi:GNAT superfamily N-acetyltransferase
MEFNQASLEFIDTIHEINQEYLRNNLTDNSKGFLLGNRSKKWILENLDKYFVVEEKGHMLGYVEIDFKIGEDNFATGTWESVSVQKEVLDKIKNMNFVYLVQIASNRHRKGVGKRIVEGLSQKFTGSILISFVAYKPYLNEASLRFHEKAGFRKVGLFSMKYKFGIQDYEHICYVK